METDASGGSPSNMAITGSGLEFDLDFLGNLNILFEAIVSIDSYIKMDFTGTQTK